MPQTVQQIVDQVIVELSQVPGSSTQIYATPRILYYVQDAFDMIFQQHWWGDYCDWVDGQLDGTTGRLVADVIPQGPVMVNGAPVPITKYGNIRQVFIGTTNREVRELPARMNPNLVTGTMVMYKRRDNINPNRPIRFYPVDAIDTVVMEVRQEPPHPFALTDTIYFDPLMLVLATCYMYAADNGTNPGQINKFQSMFTKRMSDMVAAEGDTTVLLDPRFPADELWQEDTNAGNGFTIGISPLGAGV
jgi:hypothetical protein